MSAIVILLLASLALACLFLAAFIWSVRHGQFDDPVTPAFRILTEDDPAPVNQAGPTQPHEKDAR